MKQGSCSLTDLLNRDPSAYEYFYSLPPAMQTSLQQQGQICSLKALRDAVATVSLDERPRAF
ncbi:MAG: hypothetical protein GXW99_01135 [Clostridiales bacterium]|nr:hypothetical protein [Clostridiales bacterium]